MTDNLSAQKPFTIPAGTDFNGLVQPGTYQQLWYDANAQNTPTGGNACQLAVSRIADNVILQTCTVWRRGLVYETYQRIREAGTWTAWDKILSDSDAQQRPVTQILSVSETVGNGSTYTWNTELRAGDFIEIFLRRNTGLYTTNPYFLTSDSEQMRVLVLHPSSNTAPTVFITATISKTGISFTRNWWSGNEYTGSVDQSVCGGIIVYLVR